MEVQIMILGTPHWANGQQAWQWMPKDPQDFADFATAASRHFPNVNFWMIWGEPNRAPNFQPFTPANSGTGYLNEEQRKAPENYALLLDYSYQALKNIDQENMIIGGNTYTSAGNNDINPYQWIRYLQLPDGSKPRLDYWGHNPFTFRFPELNSLMQKPAPRGVVPFSDLRRLVRVLDRYYPQRPKLFLAEWGVPHGFTDSALDFSLNAKEARRWISSAYRIARRWDRIYTLGWIHPVDSESSSMGLLNSSGAKKSTFKAFKRS